MLEYGLGRELLVLAGIVAVWFALFRWILPRFGIRTCISGACRSADRHEETGDGLTSGGSGPRSPDGRR